MSSILCQTQTCEFNACGWCKREVLALNKQGQCLEYWNMQGQPRRVYVNPSCTGPMVDNPMVSSHLEIIDVQGEIRPAEEKIN